MQVFAGMVEENGKQKRVYRSFTSPYREVAELEAAEFAAARKLQIEQETVAPQKRCELLGDAIDKYIDMNRGVLDETTICGYEKIRRNDFQELMDRNIYDLTQEIMQLAVSREAQRITRRGKKISPKTVHNAYGLISGVLRNKGIIFRVNLPKVPEKFI